jgi:hypothetical protein
MEEAEMIRKYISSLVIAVCMLTGATFGQNGHGTHVAGTFGAVGNNGVASTSGGQDLLIGGRTSFDLESQIIMLGAAAAQMAATQRRGVFVISTGSIGQY